LKQPEDQAEHAICICSLLSDIYVGGSVSGSGLGIFPSSLSLVIFIHLMQFDPSKWRRFHVQ